MSLSPVASLRKAFPFIPHGSIHQKRTIQTQHSNLPGLDDPTIVSQCVVFLIAGYGTTASALSYTAFLLAKYPEAQERLRRELHEVVEEHGDVTYQGIMEAKFLDACIMGECL